MVALFNSWVSTAIFGVLITAVFVGAFIRLWTLRKPVDDRNKELDRQIFTPKTTSPSEALRVEIEGLMKHQSDLARGQTMHRYQSEANRLESSVAFYVDLLRQLGLLGTVLGLGLALTLQDAAIDNLLAPLSLAVWTTVIGLIWSLVISATFSNVGALADNCERLLEAAVRSKPAPDQPGA
ncbi:MAG: MotA/TolQ/ExbB proton channel family protein [Rhodoglobus sp.]